jgi:hypothetical protein
MRFIPLLFFDYSAKRSDIPALFVAVNMIATATDVRRNSIMQETELAELLEHTPLPFLEALSWNDAGRGHTLTPQEALQRSETGWRFLGVLADPTASEWRFIAVLVEYYASELSNDPHLLWRIVDRERNTFSFLATGSSLTIIPIVIVPL